MTSEALRTRMLLQRWELLWLDIHGIEAPADLEVERFTTEMELSDLLAQEAS